MLTDQIVPLSRIQPFLDRLSSQAGFVCMDVDRGKRRLVSALPVRHWVLSDQPRNFRSAIDQIRSAHHDLAGYTRGGALAGSFWYEAGRQTVPGFKDDSHVGGSGWVGLYLWTLKIPAEQTSGDGLLEFHRDCPNQLRQQVTELLSTADCENAAGPEFCIVDPFAPRQSADQYRQGVVRILDYINAGDCYQANLSQQFRGRYRGRPWQAWKALLDEIPVPHGGYLDTGPWQLLSISPEMFLEVRDGVVTSRPIKGTRPRSGDCDTDRELAIELAQSPKDRAENLMIVDLIRNDLSHFCAPFTVKVPQLFQVESYRNVHQLVSTVTGLLRADITPLDALLSAFPGGSITGAPKRRAMEIIAELEPHQRGPYCGSLFWWSANGNLDSNIAIRSLQTRADGEILAWAGCGIVADSDPEAEYQESITKIGQLLTTLEALGRPR